MESFDYYKTGQIQEFTHNRTKNLTLRLKMIQHRKHALEHKRQNGL